MLRVIQDNRAVPIYDGADKDGTPSNGKQESRWNHRRLSNSLQEQEKMSFTNTAEEWQKHSVNMPLVSQCTTQVDNEYTKRSAVDSFDEKWVDNVANGPKTDIGNKKKASKVPQQEQEKALVHEILTCSNFFVETPNRKFVANHVWNALGRVTTTLSKPEPKQSVNDFDEDTILEQIASEALGSVPLELRGLVRGMMPT